MTRRIEIYLAILTMGQIRAELSAWKDRLLTQTHQPDSPYSVAIDHSKARPIPANRNGIWQRFKKLRTEEKGENGQVTERPWGDWLIMCDEDTVPRSDILAWTQSDKDIISWPCPVMRDLKKARIDLNFRLGDTGKLMLKDGKRIVKAERIGTGLFMVRRKVTETRGLHSPFADRFTNEGQRRDGSDGVFSERALKAGYDLWVPLDEPASHYKTVDLMAILMHLYQRAGEAIAEQA